MPVPVPRHHLSYFPSRPQSLSSTPPFLAHVEAFEPGVLVLSPVCIPLASSYYPDLRLRRSTGGLRSACCAKGGDGTGAGDGLKGFVGNQVDALLQKEENRALLEGLEDATRRVEDARRALADIERQEAEAARVKEYVLQLESRKSEIEESQRELMEARSMVEEATRSLSSSLGSATSGEPFSTGDEVSKELDRLESIKAAVISSVVGALAGLPISLYQATSSSQLVAHLAVISISCALFGVTFRYTVRRELDNVQLKTGTWGAFAIVRGLSAAEMTKPWELDGRSFIPSAFDGAIHVLEAAFIFIFSAVALDYCFKVGLLSPFPTRR